MSRGKIYKIIVWFVIIILSWYGMMAVHEAGHCLGALIAGAKIEAVKIPIADFSRTDFSGGRNTLLVIAAGPLLGAILPMTLLLILRAVKDRIKNAIMFFVGFCLLANGTYIGLGAFLRAGDCRQLIQQGVPIWQLIVFGLVSSGAGLFIWHCMGPPKSWFSKDRELNGCKVVPSPK